MTNTGASHFLECVAPSEMVYKNVRRIPETGASHFLECVAPSEMVYKNVRRTQESATHGDYKCPFNIGARNCPV